MAGEISKAIDDLIEAAQAYGACDSSCTAAEFDVAEQQEKGARQALLDSLRGTDTGWGLSDADLNPIGVSK